MALLTNSHSPSLRKKKKKNHQKRPNESEVQQRSLLLCRLLAVSGGATVISRLPLHYSDASRLKEETLMRENAVSLPRVTWTDPPPKVEEIICASSSAKVILLHEGRFLFLFLFSSCNDYGADFTSTLPLRMPSMCFWLLLFLTVCLSLLASNGVPWGAQATPTRLGSPGATPKLK